MTFPRLPSGSRAGRRQVSLWLSEEDWRFLDAIGRERDLGRGRLLALLLGGMGHSALAEAVARDSMVGYRQGWARPVLSGKVPPHRFGRVRLAVWLDERLARDVAAAFRSGRRRRDHAGGASTLLASRLDAWRREMSRLGVGDAAERAPAHLPRE